MLSCTLVAAPAVADIADGLNDIRRRGCEGHPGVKQALRSSRGLDSVAREWSKGGRLKEALERTDYRGTHTASMRLEGSADEKMILGVLRELQTDLSGFSEALTKKDADILEKYFTEGRDARRRMLGS